MTGWRGEEHDVEVMLLRSALCCVIVFIFSSRVRVVCSINARVVTLPFSLYLFLSMASHGT
jgi:hypothetical protein